MEFFTWRDSRILNPGEAGHRIADLPGCGSLFASWVALRGARRRADGGKPGPFRRQELGVAGERLALHGSVGTR